MWSVVLICGDQGYRNKLVDILSSIDRRIYIYSTRDTTQALSLTDTINPMLAIIADPASPTRLLKGVTTFHKHKPRIPVLVEVPGDHPLIALQALGAGAIDSLRQPVAPWEWQRRCRGILEAQRQKRVIVRALKSKGRALLRPTETEEIIEPLYLISILSRTDLLHDAVTAKHDRRAGQLARLIAESLGLSAKECDQIQVGASLHDIGKIGIPDRVLRKPGCYTTEDRSIMKAHPQIGYDILKNGITPALHTCAEIALSHHERYDGSGYPKGLAGEAIPLSGRIAAVADVFDALTARGLYRRSLSVAEALNYLNGMRRRHFDPDCVEALRSRQKEATQIVG